MIIAIIDGMEICQAQHANLAFTTVLHAHLVLLVPLAAQLLILER